VLAKWLFTDVEILIMDEPTSHLDFKNKNLIMREIKKLTKNSDTGVIMALHDPNLAMKYCDRVIIVKEGKIMADGDTEEIMTGSNLGHAYDIDIKINEKAKGIEIALPEL
jgi:iron complex transport system ATP-binding protein